MISHTLYNNHGNTWLAFGHDPEKPENIIDTNQIVITSGDQAIILDPGGVEIFPAMLAALTDKVPIENVKNLFMSHQDPDIGSSLPLWRQVCNADVEIHLSWLWTSFVGHFDAEANLSPIPDQGQTIKLGSVSLELIPAHYLHSSGNFSVYDAAARILWSGDIGAALLPPGKQSSFFVEDFDAHIQYIEGFHKRWMGSPQARDAWINRVSKLDIDILTPQHGLFFRGADVSRFLDWFGSLEIGSGIAAMGTGHSSPMPTTVDIQEIPATADIQKMPAEADIQEMPAAVDIQEKAEPPVIKTAKPKPAVVPANPVVEPAPQENDAVLPEFDASVGGYVFPE